MVAFKRSQSKAGGPFRFRVSDSLEIPLRGHMLRLRVIEGTPSMTDLQVGSRLRLVSPRGAERVVTIADHAIVGGRQTQQRLDRTRELDVVVSAEDGGQGTDRVDIGWLATGPISADGKEGKR